MKKKTNDPNNAKTHHLGQLLSPPPFGPSIPPNINSSCRFNLIYIYKQVYIEKTYLWPKRRVSRRLGPFSSSPPSTFHQILKKQKHKLNTIVSIKEKRKE